jgi:hypothetical protein
MTRSTGTSGLIFWGSPPARFMAVRMAARSTTAGTPVKSCNTTRATLNGTSTGLGFSAFHAARPWTSSSATSKLSVLRRQLSKSTLMENGSLSTCPMPDSTSLLSRKYRRSPPLEEIVASAPNGLRVCCAMVENASYARGGRGQEGRGMKAEGRNGENSAFSASLLFQVAAADIARTRSENPRCRLLIDDERWCC